MKKHVKYILFSIALTGALTGGARADSVSKGRTPIGRDRTYEQNLRWEAGNDKTITPAKVIRWMTSYRGRTPSAPSNTEFVPTVNVYDSKVRIVASFAYKF